MAEFTVEGPFKVPVYEGKNGRIVRSEEGEALFRHHARLASKRGCYVFGMRSGGGTIPTYVGQATKSFKSECFTAHKLGKCNESLVDAEKGTLVVFFVIAPSGRGRPAAKQIDLLEQFLIQAGVAANPNLLNVKGTKEEEWSIRGVIRAPRGRPSAAASAFRSAMKLQSAA